MAKFFGKIGYAVTEEKAPSVYEEVIVEREYFGDFIRNVRKLETSGNVNDDLIITNEVSIVADPFAYENFHSMRYLWYMGARWKITSVEVQYPRLILSIGGVYHGPEAV